jgi:hypothetical protein
MKKYTQLETEQREAQARFDKAIYLTYVEYGKYNQYKRINKELFIEMLNNKVDKKTTHEFDKKRIYRIADSKEIWIDKNKNVLGEVFTEVCRDNEDIVLESFWINEGY